MSCLPFGNEYGATMLENFANPKRYPRMGLSPQHNTSVPLMLCQLNRWVNMLQRQKFATPSLPIKTKSMQRKLNKKTRVNAKA